MKTGNAGRNSRQGPLFAGLAALVMIAGCVTPASSRAAAMQADALVGSCTPELVYTVAPGSVDASGSGSGTSASLLLTNADGSNFRFTTGTVTWSARSRVIPAGQTGARPRIGGQLHLLITTAEGEQLEFNASCVAGTGAYPGGIFLYTNGLTRGWPGGTSVRRSFVHFEAYTDGETYVALIDGVDCALNFGTLLVTDEIAVGTNDFSKLPPSSFVYSETDCARRFGNPFPATLAPGQGG